LTQPPVYFPFYRAVESGGRTIVCSPLALSGGRYEMDLADLDGRLAAGARLLLLCSPHNPGGRVWSREELEAVVAAAARRDALVVCDEIHADVVFPGSRHIPIGSLPGAGTRVITVSGPTKAFNFPGMPIGYTIIADETLRKRFREELRRTASPAPSIFAIDALEAAYREGGDWLDEAVAYLDGNRAAVDRFCAESIPGVRAMSPQASYLSWIDFRGLGLSENALHELLVGEAGVGLNRGSAFGAEGTGFMRLNFGCRRALLMEALERIRDALRRG
jgi:cystathionine beta-lyase